MSATPVEYPASKTKLVINFVIGGFLLLIGILFSTALFDDPGNPLGWAGAAAALGGIAIIAITFRRNMGRSIIVHDDRVERQVRGNSQSWQYDTIDGIRVAAGKTFRHGRNYYNIKNYEFLVNGERALSIPPVYVNWQDAGQRLILEVKKRLAARYVERINAGEDVHFDLKTANLGRGMRLKLDAQGITEGDNGLIPWSTVTVCGFHPNDQGMAVVDTTGKNQVIAFRYFGSVNSMVAMDVMRAMAAQPTGPTTQA